MTDREATPAEAPEDPRAREQADRIVLATNWEEVTRLQAFFRTTYGSDLLAKVAATLRPPTSD
jgi:hypothetical protein